MQMSVVVEVKAIQRLSDIEESQIIHCLKASGLKTMLFT